MNVEDIAIMSETSPSGPYKVIGLIEARVAPGGPGLWSVFGRSRTIEEVNSKLREEAMKVGANAVIGVSYNRGMSVSSNTFKLVTAKGTAIVLHSADRTCPFCAETIKREAVVCRFCGRDLPVVTQEQDIELVRRDYPDVVEEALVCLTNLDGTPANPAGWLRELCRRIDAGSPPEAAAARIPLDLS